MSVSTTHQGSTEPAVVCIHDGSLLGHPALILLDPGTTDTYVSESWVTKHNIRVPADPDLSGPAGSDAPAAPRRACMARRRGRARLARPPSCQTPATQALCLRAPLCAQSWLSFLGPAPTPCKHIARHSLSAALGEQPDNPQPSQPQVLSLGPPAVAGRNPVHGQAASRAARHGHAASRDSASFVGCSAAKGPGEGVTDAGDRLIGCV
jgi:hypothetical protein